MEIRKINDVKILDVIAKELPRIKKQMQMMENYQWNDTYPQKSDFKNDFNLGQLYGCFIYDELVGIFVPTRNFETHYYEKEHTFKYAKPEDDIVYIHRFFALENAPKKSGVLMLKAIVNYFEAYCDTVQIDTNKRNIPMNKIIKRAGFTEVGSFDRYEKTPESPNWICYEY